MEEKIYVQPFAEVDSDVISRIDQGVEDAFSLPAEQLPSAPVPNRAFSGSRGQYHSTALLQFLLQRVPDGAVRVLGVTDVDLFVPQLNFVFGEATVDGLVGVISLRRLRPEFYGKAADHELFIERAMKEAVHELGHTFGLRHCRDSKCVMYFSNNIEDTDRKSSRFCADHAHQLALKLRPLRSAA